MNARKMAPEQQWTAVGRGLAWLLGVTLVVWVCALPSARSVGDVFGGLMAAALVGGFVGWFVWWRLMYLTRDGRAHQGWRREQREMRREQYERELDRRAYEADLAAQAAEWQRIADLRLFVINRWRTYTGNYDGMPSDAEIARMMMDAEAEDAAQARHADAMNQQAVATGLLVGSVYGVGMQMDYLAHHPQPGWSFAEQQHASWQLTVDRGRADALWAQKMFGR